MAEITFICKRTVVSTKPVQPGKFYHLSVLDRAMERNHIRMVYYYRTPVERDVGESTKKLRESLSEMLCGFTMVTGRLLRNEKGQWMVKCNDAGVRMVEARAKGSIDGWLRKVDREKELKLVHWEDMFHKPYFWSTFYVQLTEFEEGGIAIGLSCTHLLADPFCATMFIKAWADTTLGGKIVNPLLFHPLPVPPRTPATITTNHKLYSTTLLGHYKLSMDQKRPVPNTTAKHTTVTLEFTDKMVQSCMAMAGTSLNTQDGSTLTPFEALAGLFWVCVSKAKGIRRNGLANMSICFDMRKVLNLDKGFFGNCMVYNKVHGEDIEESGVSKAAIAIREVEKKTDMEGTMDLIEWLESTDFQSPPSMNGYELVCAKLDDLVSNSAMFEYGFDPVRFSCYIEPAFGEGQVLILPSNSPVEEGSEFGRVVMVTLPEDEVVKLCEDALLLHFSPTILMGATYVANIEVNTRNNI